MNSEEAEYDPVARDAEVDALHARVEALEAEATRNRQLYDAAREHWADTDKHLGGMIAERDRLRAELAAAKAIAADVPPPKTTAKTTRIAADMVIDQTWNDAIDACQTALRASYFNGAWGCMGSALRLDTLRRKVPR